MTKKDWKRLAIAFIAIAVVAVVAAIWFAWPKATAVSAMPEEQNLAILPASRAVVSAETVVTSTTSTDSACCRAVFVDLGIAPEGVWSNASAVVIPEGWCVVLWRDQLWQQSRDEVELRQTWQEGATEDYLLLCNPDPGSRYYSLESEFGGRPGGHEGFWNDQAKAIWVFPDPKATSCRQGTVVL